MHDDITFEQFTSTFMQLSPLERITADTASTSHVKIVLAQYVRLLGADEEPSPLPPPTEALLKAILGTVATGAYVERLLSAALVLKVYSVLASVKYPCEKLELAQQGLTDIVSSLVLLCMEHCSRQQTENAEMSVDQAIMLVAEATLPVIRHRVSFKSTSEHAGDSCLHLLVYLLDKRQQVAKQLAPMLVAQGKGLDEGSLSALAPLLNKRNFQFTSLLSMHSQCCGLQVSSWLMCVLHNLSPASLLV